MNLPPIEEVMVTIGQEKKGQSWDCPLNACWYPGGSVTAYQAAASA